MDEAHSRRLVAVYVFVAWFASNFAVASSRRRQVNECVLFKSNDTYAARVQESFLELGYYDMRRNTNFTLSFEVIPSINNHDGPLFAMGTDGFSYYEWKTKAVKTQFMVVEFFYGALSMLLKALDTEHLFQMEIHRTHPNVYHLNDVQWHTVKATREYPRNGIGPGRWRLQLDQLETGKEIEETPPNPDDNMSAWQEYMNRNVDMLDCKAYLGGRPGYRSSQFRGVMRNLSINNERVRVTGFAKTGLIDVFHCSSPEVTKFIGELEEEYILERRWRQQNQFPRRGN